MVGSKVAFFLFATLAISTALPINLGGIIGSVTGVLDNVLGDVESVVNGLTPIVSQLLNKVTALLHIPSGTNPLSFIQDLISKLEAVLNQLLAGGSGIDDLTSGLPIDINQVLAQLTQILNIPKGVNVLTFLQQLLSALEQILQQVLTIVSGLVRELLGQGGLVGDLLGSLNDLKVAVLLQKLTSTLSQIVDALNSTGGL